MSSSATPDTAAVVAEAVESAIGNFCGIAGIVFLLYEYTITFGREVDLFWTRRFSGATALFLANKYITLLNHLFDLSLYLPFHVSDKTCVGFLHVRGSTADLQCSDAIFTSKLSPPLITYNTCHGRPSPVYERVNFSTKIYGVNDPTEGCGMGEDIDRATLIKNKFARLLYCRNASTLVDVLLCDGLIYFVVLLIMNTLHIVFTFTSTSEITIFTEPVTAVLVSRFLLDLQEASQRSVVHILGTEASSRLDSSGTLTGHSVVFARLVGSLSSPIALEAYRHPAESEWSADLEAENTDCEVDHEAGHDKHGRSEVGEAMDLSQV
ncbi:hypothetical protein C8T65DRAFT_741048 [Cerioporus squamosus]|nr:hypothetical protein C8T65DRAFT_741048 [Cerioporus squamosus]